MYTRCCDAMSYTPNPTHSPPHHHHTHTHITQAWNDFASLEKGVGESERARAIFELAIAQPALDMPEVSGSIGCVNENIRLYVQE